MLLSRSSIISTSTSITSTARMRIMKVLPRYQVSVRDGKKSSSTEAPRLPAAGSGRACGCAAGAARGSACISLAIAALERADRLPAGHERRRGSTSRRSAPRTAANGPHSASTGSSRPSAATSCAVLVDLVIGDHHHDRDEHPERRGRALGRDRQRHRQQRQHQHHHHLDHAVAERAPAPRRGSLRRRRPRASRARTARAAGTRAPRRRGCGTPRSAAGRSAGRAG